MTDGPEEPIELLEVRTVSILASDPETWAIDIEFPEWMTIYEAYGMVRAAKRMLKQQMDDLNEDEEEEDDK